MTTCAHCGDPAFGRRYCSSECSILGALDEAADKRRRALNEKLLREARYLDEALDSLRA